MTATPANPTKVRGNLVADMLAGMTTGVANIPDAMASAILAGAKSRWANVFSGLLVVLAVLYFSRAAS